MEPRALFSAAFSTPYAVGPGPMAAGSGIYLYAPHPWGGGTAGANDTVRFYLSKDDLVADGDDVLVYSTPYYNSAGPLVTTLPTGLAPGDYHLIVTCDGQEPTMGSTVTLIDPPAGIDLAPSAGLDALKFFGLPSSFPRGEYHGVLTDIWNRGRTAAGPFVASLYLSPTPQLTPDSVLIDKQTVQGLGPLGTTDVTIVKNIVAPAGDYYPILVLDPDHQIAEADETNNLIVGDIVHLTQPTVDLKVTSVTPALTQLQSGPVGPSFGVDVTVASVGTPTDFRLLFTLSRDQVLGNADDVAVGYSDYTYGMGALDEYALHATVTLPAGLTAGEYHLFANTDAPPDVTPDDNALSAPIEVLAPPAPDLTLGPLTATLPANVYPLSRINAWAEVQPTGTLSRYVDVRYALSTDDVAGNEDDIELGVVQQWVNSGGAVAIPFDAYWGWNYPGSLVIPASVTPGDYHLLAVVDPSNAVAESDETNNSVVGPLVTVTDAPPLDLTPGTVTVANPGPYFAGYPLYLTGVTVANRPFAQTVRRTYALSLDDVAGNDDDIILGSQVDVPAQSDSGYDWLAPIDPWGPVTFDTDAVLQIWPPYYSWPHASFDIPTSVAPGTYHLIVTVDSDGQVDETDETNNTLVGPTVTIEALPALPDLAIDSPSIGPGFLVLATLPSDSAGLPTYAAGSNVTLNATVRTNRPVAQAKVRYVLSADDVAGNADDIELATTTQSPTGPGNTGIYYQPDIVSLDSIIFQPTYRIPDNVPAGNYHLIAIVDPDAEITESDETNNVAIGPTIHITEPIHLIGVDPLPVGGQPVDVPPTGGDDGNNAPQSAPPTIARIYMTGRGLVTGGKLARGSLLLHNKGLTSRTFAMRYYLSSDQTLSDDDVPISPPGRSRVSVAAGKTARHTVSWRIPPGSTLGTKYLIAVADPIGAATAAPKLTASTRLKIVAPKAPSPPHQIGRRWFWHGRLP